MTVLLITAAVLIAVGVWRTAIDRRGRHRASRRDRAAAARRWPHTTTPPPRGDRP